jgi:EAL domain-containing protein (putative c-di-GMP-specific phosphodiesterase class I)/PleD family two-component response regulator
MTDKTEDKSKEGITILVVDDHEDNRFMLTRRLKKLGYNNSIEAENGVKALEALKNNDIDLMLLDLMMPEMDGFEVLEILNKEGSIHKIPVIMISADHNMDNVIKGIGLGAIDYLPKPFQPQILSARINATLEQKRLREFEKSYLELHDGETGFANRKKTIIEVQKSIENNADKTIALVLLRANTLREIGASAGSKQQKLFLEFMVSKLKPLVDEGYLVARTSEFNFAFTIASDETQWDIVERMSEILNDIKLPVVIDGQEYNPNPVLGISFYAEETVDAAQMISEAGIALDRAEPNSEDELEVFDPEMQEQIINNNKLQIKLLHAIEDKEFELYYQPFIDMKAGDIIGAEALIRWNDKDGKIVTPFHFIPLAEETGLILPMGKWIIEDGFRQASLWNKIGKKFIMSINVSPRQFLEQDLLAICKKQIEKYGEMPMKLEITESSIMKNPEKSNTILTSLRQLGLSPSMDDFGTGYSSLSTLHEFPFNTIKIDQSFIRRITKEEGARAIVQAIIVMAHALALDVVAEGIETKEELMILREMNCDIGQGYYFSKPIKVDEFDALLEQKPKW